MHQLLRRRWWLYWTSTFRCRVHAWHLRSMLGSCR